LAKQIASLAKQIASLAKQIESLAKQIESLAKQIESLAEQVSHEGSQVMAKAIAVAEEQNKLVGGITGWWERSVGFLTDVRNEMRKVNTPSRAEVQTTTIVVVATVFAFAAYFYLIDRVIGAGLDTLLHKLATHS